MHHKIGDIITGLIGAIVGLFTTTFLGITWETVFSNARHLLWVCIVALSTGAMTVLGKRVGEWILKKWKNKKVKRTSNE